MHLWRITPTARPSDTRWEDHPIFTEVVVRAESAALARVVAGKKLFQGNGKTQHDSIFISAFADEKLYGVSRLISDARFLEDGVREVVHSEILST